MVYVLNKDNKPLMPTNRHSKVRRLLKSGLAKVVNRTPFTIQLLYEAAEYTQAITLGVDAGSKTVGLSATTMQKELYASEAVLRNNIVELLSERRQYRRTRRNRLRYREPRFNNRVKTKKEGWIAPSIKHKVDSHIKLVKEVHKILPITKIIVEVAAFDIQKIKDFSISSIEYQQGDQMGFWNVREYVLFRDNHTCQHCKGKSKDKRLNVHHIECRQTGGDSPGNLTVLCETCHNDYHAGKIELKVKRGASFRDAAFMGIMRWAFYNQLKQEYAEVNLTYGYITKNTRISNNIEKTHAADAYSIRLKGGIRKANKAPTLVLGYRIFDKVLFEERECFIFGRRATGYFDLRLLDGASIHKSASHKKLKLLSVSKTLLTERRRQESIVRQGQFLPA